MVTPEKLRWAGLVVAVALAGGGATLTSASSLAASSSPAASGTSATGTGTGSAMSSTTEHAVLHSRELWATIDECDPPDHRNMVGVRGSMPGDGATHDAMYMSFHLQYMTAAKRWLDIPGDASSSWALVGGGGSPRQGGSTFGLKPVSHATSFRGVVEFQWRRSGKVLLTTSAPTSAGHKSLAGADPANFSAASCAIS